MNIWDHFQVVVVDFVDRESAFGIFCCCSGHCLDMVFTQDFTMCLCFCLPSSRMIDIQTKMAERALELLCLPDDQPCYLLDIG